MTFHKGLWRYINNSNDWWLLCSHPSTGQLEEPLAEKSHHCSQERDTAKQGDHRWVLGTSLNHAALPPEARQVLDVPSVALNYCLSAKIKWETQGTHPETFPRMPRATPTPRQLAQLQDCRPVEHRTLEACPKSELLRGAGQTGTIRVINIEHSIASLLLALW